MRHNDQYRDYPQPNTKRHWADDMDRAMDEHPEWFEIKVEKPTPEDVEKAKKSPWYMGYTYGKMSEKYRILDMGFFDRLKFILRGK